MILDKIREISAGLLKIGKSKVWFDSEKLDQIKEAMTKEDVRGLIAEKAIGKKKPSQHSRGRARVLHQKKKKGRKRGYGKRKGLQSAREKTKEKWMLLSRALRKKLKEMKGKKEKLKVDYRKLYNLSKGGYFKGKKYLEAYALGKETKEKK
ncbi:MAG: 50S ribosomal protein L19e [Candidatus Diapherotrites archaeon]